MKNNWANRTLKEIIEALKKNGFKFSEPVEDQMGVSIRTMPNIPPACGCHIWLRTVRNCIIPRFCPADQVTDKLWLAMDDFILETTKDGFDIPLDQAWRQNNIEPNEAAEIIIKAFIFYDRMWRYVLYHQQEALRYVTDFLSSAQGYAKIQTAKYLRRKNGK